MKFETLKENYETKEKYVPKLQVNTFISFMDKLELTTELKDKCIDVAENGLYTIDYIMKNMVIDLFLVRVCSNIELDYTEEGSLVDQYDFLIEKKIIEKIIEKIVMERNNEFTMLMEHCSKTLEQEIKVRNSIEGILANNIQKLVDKMPDEKGLMKLAKSIKNIDPKKFKMITDLFNFAKNKETEKIDEKEKIDEINEIDKTNKKQEENIKKE